MPQQTHLKFLLSTKSTACSSLSIQPIKVSRISHSVPTHATRVSLASLLNAQAASNRLIKRSGYRIYSEALAFQSVISVATMMHRPRVVNCVMPVAYSVRVALRTASHAARQVSRSCTRVNAYENATRAGWVFPLRISALNALISVQSARRRSPSAQNVKIVRKVTCPCCIRILV